MFRLQESKKVHIIKYHIRNFDARIERLLQGVQGPINLKLRKEDEIGTFGTSIIYLNPFAVALCTDK